LHMIETARGIDCATDLRSHSQRLRRKVKDASIILVSNFGDGDLLVPDCQRAKIVNLAAAGRIESRSVEHNGSPAIAVEGFDHTSVKVIKKRVVIIKAISHWKLLAVSTFN
jgi:autonomous glycyl radical cofactor GrcA